MRRKILCLAAVALLIACEQPSGGGNPLDPRTGGTSSKTLNCVSVHPDGVQCNKMECKKDDKSDCQKFAGDCIRSGHHYNGASEAGTCSRIL